MRRPTSVTKGSYLQRAALLHQRHISSTTTTPIDHTSSAESSPRPTTSPPQFLKLLFPPPLSSQPPFPGILKTAPSHITSYTWRSAFPATIDIPGAPPHFINTLPPVTPLIPDRGSYYIDANAALHPPSPLTPLLVSASLTKRRREPTPHIITDRENLLRLLRFVKGNTRHGVRFAISAQMVGETLLLQRQEDRNVGEEKVGFGFGRGYREAVTEVEEEHEDRGGHWRTVAYGLGGMRVWVMYETDAVLDAPELTENEEEEAEPRRTIDAIALRKAGKAGGEPVQVRTMSVKWTTEQRDLRIRLRRAAENAELHARVRRAERCFIGAKWSVRILGEVIAALQRLEAAAMTRKTGEVTDLINLVNILPKAESLSGSDAEIKPPKLLQQEDTTIESEMISEPEKPTDDENEILPAMDIKTLAKAETNTPLELTTIIECTTPTEAGGQLDTAYGTLPALEAIEAETIKPSESLISNNAVTEQPKNVPEGYSAVAEASERKDAPPIEINRLPDTRPEATELEILGNFAIKLPKTSAEFQIDTEPPKPAEEPNILPKLDPDPEIPLSDLLSSAENLFYRARALVTQAKHLLAHHESFINLQTHHPPSLTSHASTSRRLYLLRKSATLTRRLSRRQSLLNYAHLRSEVRQSEHSNLISHFPRHAASLWFGHISNVVLAEYEEYDKGRRGMFGSGGRLRDVSERLRRWEQSLGTQIALEGLVGVLEEVLEVVGKQRGGKGRRGGERCEVKVEGGELRIWRVDGKVEEGGLVGKEMRRWLLGRRKPEREKEWTRVLDERRW